MTPKELQVQVADLPSYILDDDFIIYHRYIPLMNDTIIDLGTGWGKSAIAMAILNPSVTVITVDDGSYPIYQKWANDQEGYRKRLEDSFIKHKVINIDLKIHDITNMFLSDRLLWPLIHFDLTKENEIKVLKMWLPKIKMNGLALIRNFERLKDSLGDLLNDFEYIDHGGLIHVYRRYK